jgi:DNA-binding winged helix-turn-helix (wHTH) protein
VDFRILGPLEVSSDGERLPLGGPNQRALLALLILHANESIRRDLLIDEIWGESPPRTAPVSLNGYVSKLRKLLVNGSGAALETRPEGYALRVEPDQTQSRSSRPRSSSGAVRRSPTSPTRHSRNRRSRAWRRFTSLPARTATS